MVFLGFPPPRSFGSSCQKAECPVGRFMHPIIFPHVQCSVHQGEKCLCRRVVPSPKVGLFVHVSFSSAKRNSPSAIPLLRSRSQSPRRRMSHCSARDGRNWPQSRVAKGTYPKGGTPPRATHCVACSGIPMAHRFGPCCVPLSRFHCVTGSPSPSPRSSPSPNGVRLPCLPFPSRR